MVIREFLCDPRPTIHHLWAFSWIHKNKYDTADLNALWLYSNVYVIAERFWKSRNGAQVDTGAESISWRN